MSLIEKLDSVLALVSEAAPGEWSPHPTMDYSICLQDGSFIDITRHRAFGEVAERDAIIATLNLLRDHGPAIRQALLKACYWDTFCELAEAGTFHAGVLEDAKHMGAGVLEMAMKDAAIDARLASDSATGEGEGHE